MSQGVGLLASTEHGAGDRVTGVGTAGCRLPGPTRARIAPAEHTSGPTRPAVCARALAAGYKVKSAAAIVVVPAMAIAFAGAALIAAHALKPLMPLQLRSLDPESIHGTAGRTLVIARPISWSPVHFDAVSTASPSGNLATLSRRSSARATGERLRPTVAYLLLRPSPWRSFSTASTPGRDPFAVLSTRP
jgi:hypothetical protein